MVWTLQNFELFDRKWLTIFDKALMPLWKKFLQLKQLFDETINLWTKIFQYSKITVVRQVYKPG